MALITQKDRTVPVTVQTRAAASPRHAFEVNVPIDLSLVFKGWGPFPAVRGVKNQTGAWPTSGIGYATALELAKHGTVVLVGRDRGKLAEVQKAIERNRQRAVSVVCDLSDLSSLRRAAAEIIALNLPIVGLLNNAGIMQMRPAKNARGWDMTFATNHLGPFALTEALLPHLPDGANVVFVASAVENPEHKPAKAVGFRGGRYISAEASARGEWNLGGAKWPGFDAYATSKQAILATGVNPTTALARDAGAFTGFMAKFIIPLLVPLLMPFVKVLSTPKRAARMITKGDRSIASDAVVMAMAPARPSFRTDNWHL
jgi:NAD(P)-dependent dehydrogenase (short-subunit alcohol dehydrogenase family)